MNVSQIKKPLKIVLFLTTLALSVMWVITVTAAPTANFGDIIINEVMQNPAGGLDDGSAESVEIVNLTGSGIDINGWEFQPGGVFGSGHTFSGAPVVSPGDYYVICKNGDTGLNGGIACDYVISDMDLGNGAETVSLIEGVTTIAIINYDGGPSWPDPVGASMQYSVPNGGGGAAAENDNGANWSAPTTSEYFTGNFGTPGAVNDDWNPTAVTLQSVTTSSANFSTALLTVSLVLFIFSGLLFYIRRQQA